jgi:hypothetical protein
MDPEMFDPTTYVIKSPQFATFKAWLKREKLRYTQFTVPHPCPLCTAGPLNRVIAEDVVKQINALAAAGSPIPAELMQRSSKLRTSDAVYRTHVLQLETCRKEAKAIETNLTKGECALIRDFVNHHDHAGKHVKCLHWVIAWRDEDDGEIKRLKLRHYCSHVPTMSTDSYFQADVVDFHFNEDNPHCPLLFKEFHTLYFIGDHGPHFASHATLYNETTFKRKYGKTLRIVFLTSYHAYSRADGSGSEDSTALRRDLRQGLGRFGSTDMTQMTNMSHDNCSWAYDFPAINRGVDIFPAKKLFGAADHAKWIRKWCEVKFTSPGTEEKYDGILQYRLVPGVGVWKWTDLVAAKREEGEVMCDSCSTKQDCMVMHAQDECPDPRYIHDMPTYEELQPNAGRIHGEQVLSKKASAKSKSANTYPCKFADCPHKTNKRRAFRSAARANAHMQGDHKPTAEEFKELAYPEEEQASVAGANPPPAVPAQQASPAVEQPKKKRAERRGKEPIDTDSASASENSTEKDEGDSSEEEDSSAEGSDGQGDQGGAGDDDKDLEDPDESIDLGEKFVVEQIKGCRLKDNGEQEYRIKYVGYNGTSWTKAKNVHEVLRGEYHKKVADDERAAAKKTQQRREAADATAIAGGGNVRSRRTGAKSKAELERRRTAVAAIAHQLQDKQGLTYFVAFEKAEQMVPLC